MRGFAPAMFVVILLAAGCGSKQRVQVPEVKVEYVCLPSGIYCGMENALDAFHEAGKLEDELLAQDPNFNLSPALTPIGDGKWEITWESPVQLEARKVTEKVEYLLIAGQP